MGSEFDALPEVAERRARKEHCPLLQRGARPPPPFTLLTPEAVPCVWTRTER